MKIYQHTRSLAFLPILVLAVLSTAMQCSTRSASGDAREIAETPPLASSPSTPPGDFKIPEEEVHAKTLGDLSYTEGTLDLVPGIIGAAGEVRYRIYSNGVITYEGFVTYFGQFEVTLGGPASDSRDFRGAIQARPDSVQSASYDRVDREGTDYLLHTKVVKRKDKTAEVSIAGLSYGAKGTVIVNLSQPLVTIDRASLSGKIWGVPLTLEAIARSK